REGDRAELVLYQRGRAAARRFGHGDAGFLERQVFQLRGKEGHARAAVRSLDRQGGEGAPRQGEAVRELTAGIARSVATKQSLPEAPAVEIASLPPSRFGGLKPDVARAASVGGSLAMTPTLARHSIFRRLRARPRERAPRWSEICPSRRTA